MCGHATFGPNATDSDRHEQPRGRSRPIIGVLGYVALFAMFLLVPAGMVRWRLVCLILGLALWLGSTAAAVASIVPAGILALRIVVEENMLARSLPDYPAYTRRVRWRLVPGLW